MPDVIHAEAFMSPVAKLRLLLCAAPALLFAPAALAQPKEVGGAAVVVNDVRGDNQGKRARMAPGDRVFANQGVQTAAQSMAKFVFLDDTNMTLGPDSRAKLDQFVFDANGKGTSVAVSASKGAFRFVSGTSPSEAYKVMTPHANIGVRGTTYDVRVQNGRTLVVLQQGAVNVCLRNGSLCRELTRPGESLVVTDTEIAGPISPANKPWDFGGLCAGRPGDLCGATQFAQTPPAQTRRAEPANVQRPRASAPPRR
ncbi:MAG: FecR domain-containing protein, partial [Beijerinckiaceae bacterium]|nr:FecR domain-containing protein [Beijerinckiaceae bacterium]